MVLQIFSDNKLGTWLSLSDFRVKRGVSDPIELKDRDQLKISDSLLTFEFNNFDNFQSSNHHTKNYSNL